MKSLYILVALSVLVGNCAHPPGLVAHHAVKISFPVPAVIDQVHQSITLNPTLELKNTSSDTLGLDHGRWGLDNVAIDYELFAPAGSKMRAIGTVSLRSVLAGTRVCVSLLKPGESITWSQNEATNYAVARRGMYRIIAHVHVAVPDPQMVAWCVPLAEASQITGSVHHFDSDAFTFPVE
jgi:hypothetical protein